MHFSEQAGGTATIAGTEGVNKIISSVLIEPKQFTIPFDSFTV